MSASPLDDAIARQYGTWVYPRPAEDLVAYARAGRDICDPALNQRLFWPDRDPRPLDILVAGCGANQAADIAFHNRGSKVLGIDVSEASLAHERFLKGQHGLDNLELLRLPIEHAPTLGRDFDLILCTGVLHHMADPLAGAKALAKCLRGDGALAGYLYGRHGRVAVEILQDLFRQIGLQQDAPSIALVKETLSALPKNHPAQTRLAEMPDLSFDAGIVDLLLNAREQSYTVPQCLEFIAASGLVFQGWVENAHYHPEACLRADHPLYARIAGLPEPEIWDATDLVQCNPGHFFIACRPERPSEQYRIDFASADADGYIPMARPGVQVVQPDMANSRPAQLSRGGLNVPLTPAQALLLNQVDGRRRLNEIPGAAMMAGLDGSAAEIARFSRGFFRSLWRLGLLFVKLPPAGNPGTG